MWAINSVTNNANPAGSVLFTDGQPLYAVRGPEGASIRLMATNFGYIDFTDTGHQPNGPHYWQIIINGEKYWYDGQGAIDLSVNADGSYLITGDGNSLSGTFCAFPGISSGAVKQFDWMMDNNYVPYQNIPDDPGKSNEELATLGKQYFPFTPYSFELAMSIYDWTTADFTRIDFLNLFTYTGVKGCPQDMDSIAKGIWTADWPPYTPSDPDYMNSFMMVPANSLEDVQAQLADNIGTLNPSNLSEVSILMAALRTMPRTSVFSKPALYSGQVAISNLGSEHFATYFTQMPANSDVTLPTLEMPLSEAIEGFMAPGNTITLKTFMSFTDSEEDAMHYSNGIVISVIPPDGATVWEKVAYITPLSDGPEKTEYLFEVGTSFKILDVETVTSDGNELTKFYLQVLS